MLHQKRLEQLRQHRSEQSAALSLAPRVTESKRARHAESSRARPTTTPPMAAPTTTPTTRPHATTTMRAPALTAAQPPPDRAEPFPPLPFGAELELEQRQRQQQRQHMPQPQKRPRSYSTRHERVAAYVAALPKLALLFTAAVVTLCVGLAIYVCTSDHPERDPRPRRRNGGANQRLRDNNPAGRAHAPFLEQGHELFQLPERPKLPRPQEYPRQLPFTPLKHDPPQHTKTAVEHRWINGELHAVRVEAASGVY